MSELRVHEMMFSDPDVFAKFLHRLPDPPATEIDFEMKMLFSLRIICGIELIGPYVRITLTDRQKQRFYEVMDGKNANE
jgi:hypothetical protein